VGPYPDSRAQKSLLPSSSFLSYFVPPGLFALLTKRRMLFLSLYHPPSWGVLPARARPHFFVLGGPRSRWPVFPPVIFGLKIFIASYEQTLARRSISVSRHIFHHIACTNFLISAPSRTRELGPNRLTRILVPPLYLRK